MPPRHGRADRTGCPSRPARPQGNRLLRPRPHAARRFRRLAHAGRRPRPVCRHASSRPAATIPTSSSSSPWRWITCPAAKTGFGTWPRRHPWDYFIGSVHYISDSWAIDNPAEIARWKDREPLEVWTAYFERLTLAAESGLFDIIGHADLCKKFCLLSPAGLHAPVHPFPASRQTPRPCRRTQHRRPAQGLPGNLSQPPHRPPRRAARRAHHLRLRRPCPERGWPELRRGRPTRPQRRLHPLLPLHQTPARGRQALTATAS